MLPKRGLGGDAANTRLLLLVAQDCDSAPEAPSIAGKLWPLVRTNRDPPDRTDTVPPGVRDHATIRSFSTDVAPGAAQAADAAVWRSCHDPTVPVSVTRPPWAVTWTLSSPNNQER
jgi:hypothetical protein